MADLRTPFDSIEGALEYVGLLQEAVQKAKDAVGEEAVRAGAEGAKRRLEALRLVTYKLDRLVGHVGTSHRLLQDLRTLRRLLLDERQSLEEEPVSQSVLENAPKSRNSVLAERVGFEPTVRY